MNPHLIEFQLMVDILTLETGQNAPLNVEEELRQDLEPVQTLLLQTEELTVWETVLKPKIVTHKDVQVRFRKYLTRHKYEARNRDDRNFGGPKI